MKLPKTRNADIVVQQLAAETLIYDLQTDKAYCLNETSALVYRHCDGQTAFAELNARHNLSDDVIYFALDELRKSNLLDEAAEYRSPLAGLTRREAVRRIGFASVAALPVISMIVAPNAASAASGSRTLRQSCTSSRDCAAGSPNCTNTPSGSRQNICCVGSDSRYDTGGLVNSCSGGTCSAATFACQRDAGTFCCSGSATASCSSSDTCACRCT